MPDPVADREPIATYQQALWRLVEHFEAHGITVSRDQPLPFAALIVGEIFWISPARLRRDLLQRQRELHFALPRSARRRA